MGRTILIIFLIESLISCQSKKTEQTRQDSVSTSTLDSISTSIPVETPKDDDREDRTVRIFPLDSILEISYYTYKVSEGKFGTSGVTIINKQKNRYVFDSEGPQIESNSDIKKISDTLFIVSVYYKVPISDEPLSKEIKVAKFDLNLNLNRKTYTFQKDTLFWPSPPPFNSKDIQRTIADYKKQLDSKFIPDSTNNDQPHIQKMFEIQERLLSSFISGCDSCSVYAVRLYKKYDPALFASDSDYAGEIFSVYNILKKR